MLASLLLLGMGASFAITFIEEAAPAYFAPWLRSLLTLVLSATGVWGWYGIHPHYVATCFATAFVATAARNLIGWVRASADEKATAIVARRVARRGPMM